MPITLKPETEKQVQEKVATGAYPSVDAVVLAGLDLLNTEEGKFKALQEGLQAAQDQVKAGQYSEYDRDDFMQRVRKQAAKNS
ncbi:type II toxin-antitoxin system ParD family antitoxin [Terasakiella sp. SH-1]|uniref:ribbon-helix-helix domain-containing protein n=1 Tax=Terasakiella sp. SH-1 TaxID=2560057 RepID=UPI00142FB866|nr:type II toxin-antitoxin system ParD family antitoxin [Terasakiella sp. SH-1]